MAESAAADSLRSKLECPVCLELFKDPKSLRCGHSLCRDCGRNLHTRSKIRCPICRRCSAVRSVDNLPTTYALMGLLEQAKAKENDGKPSCGKCGNRYDIGRLWFCTDCDTGFLCAECILDYHQSHDRERMSSVMDELKRDIKDFKDAMAGAFQDVDRIKAEADAQVKEVVEESKNLERNVDRLFKTGVADGYRYIDGSFNKFLAVVEDESNLDAGIFEQYWKALPTHSRRFSDAVKNLMSVVKMISNKVKDVRNTLRNANEIVSSIYEAPDEEEEDDDNISEDDDGANEDAEAFQDASDDGGEENENEDRARFSSDSDQDDEDRNDRSDEASGWAELLSPGNYWS